MSRLLAMMDKILFATIVIWFIGFFILSNVAGFAALLDIPGIEMGCLKFFIQMFVYGLAAVGLEVILYCILSFINVGDK